MKIDTQKYVCQLPPEIQDEILADAREAFENLAYEIDIDKELENVLNSKLCDLSDTIDIEKYKER